MRKKDPVFGQVNGHIIGRVLKEAVRRAMVVIHNERMIFETHTKEGYSGKMDDVFTSADKKAQEIYLRTFRECFPGYGVIAEEDSLVIKSSNKNPLYITTDPLDGTKAYVRKQSNGVGTMVALVHGKEVISAYIGDVNTDEVYGYRPGSNKVHRITRLDSFEVLNNTGGMDIAEGHVLLRNPLEYYSQTTKSLVAKFKNYEVMGSSIGLWAARLWKREVCALFLDKGGETPWDSTPVVGISKKLGYVFLRPVSETSGGWEVYKPILPKKKYRREHDTMIIHKNDMKKLFTNIK